MLRRSIGRLSLPPRLLLVRHAESLGNTDPTEYARTPDWRIGITAKGVEQADDAGKRIATLLQGEPVAMYVSPYKRTKLTATGIRQHLNVVGEREDPRLREQDVGNFQDPARMKELWSERATFGRFFYRFPHGENGADVCDRASSFLDSLFRERAADLEQSEGTNIVIVSHGLFLRLFVMRWFHLTVENFHEMVNPPNCGIVEFVRIPIADGRKGATMTLTEESREMLRIPKSVELTGSGHFNDMV